MTLRTGLLTLLLAVHLLPSALLSQQPHLRYDFSPGDVLHYRHTFDQNEMVGEDTFVWIWETAMTVESVDAAGNATILMQSTRDTLERRGWTMPSQGRVSLVRPKRQPLIRVVVSPTGHVSSGEILEESQELTELKNRRATAVNSWSLDDSEFAAGNAQYWFVRLPALPADARPGTFWSDTTYERRHHAEGSRQRGERLTIVERIDTTINSYRIVGFRTINGHNTLKVVHTKTFSISGRTTADNWAVASEIYFDASSGLLVRKEGTHVNTSSDARGSVHKYIVELIGRK